MPEKRCPYCHEMVDRETFARHVAKHERLREDGQQGEYATLPEGEREGGDLDGVPTVYVHKKCREATGMPEEIVRSYLKNPWLYSADATFCCGCGKHVPFRDCKWEETGENLQDYMDDLRAAKPHLKPKGCLGAAAVLIGCGIVIGSILT